MSSVKTLQELCTADPDLAEVILDVLFEVGRARDKYPPFNSAHEGYAVLYEEVDKLWDHVKVKPCLSG